MKNCMAKDGKGDFQHKPFGKAARLLNFCGFSFFTHSDRIFRFNNSMNYRFSKSSQHNPFQDNNQPFPKRPRKKQP